MVSVDTEESMSIWTYVEEAQVPLPQRLPEEIAELITEQSRISSHLKAANLNVLNSGGVVGNTVTLGAKILNNC